MPTNNKPTYVLLKVSARELMIIKNFIANDLKNIERFTPTNDLIAEYVKDCRHLYSKIAKAEKQ